MTAIDESSDLPGYPVARDPSCPFHPPAAYADWRAGTGLQRVRLWNGSTPWVISRFADIRAVLADPRVSADNRNPNLPIFNPGDENQPPAFPRMDDPEHARLRRMLTKHFTVKRITAQRPRIQQLVDTFLDRLISKGQPGDLVQDFALPVPSLVISLLLGVPYSDHDFFQRNTTALLAPQSTDEQRFESIGALFGYLLDLVRRKENEPGDDILGHLLAEHVATGELTHEQAAMNGIILLVAGHETTAKMITLSILLLLQNPDQLARIRDTDDQATIAGAVEELLRHITLAETMIVRVATADITIGGQLIQAGDGILLNLLSGNHDPAFLDHPDTFDIDRDTRGHLAFGYGVHQCLGQTLARAELQIALPALLRRLPGLRLAVPFADVVSVPDWTLTTYHLPITW